MAWSHIASFRLLHTLGSKDLDRKRQVFLTTHSPVAVRELAAVQLWRAAGDGTGKVKLTLLGVGADDQATLRACAEAFLAPKVIVCEGATEIGLMRGLDIYRDEKGLPTLALNGAALADGHGSSTWSPGRGVSPASDTERVYSATATSSFRRTRSRPSGRRASPSSIGTRASRPSSRLSLSLPAGRGSRPWSISPWRARTGKGQWRSQDVDQNLTKGDFDFLVELDETTRAKLGIAAKRGAASTSRTSRSANASAARCSARRWTNARARSGRPS